MRQPLPPTVLRLVQREREALVAKRAELTADLDRQIAELDAVLADAPDEATASPPPFTTATIVESLDRLIAAGVVSTTPAVRDDLARRGVPMPSDALFRITKAISRTGRYKGGREAGWSPKGDAPGAGSTANGASVQLGL